MHAHFKTTGSAKASREFSVVVDVGLGSGVMSASPLKREDHALNLIAKSINRFSPRNATLVLANSRSESEGWYYSLGASSDDHPIPKLTDSDLIDHLNKSTSVLSGLEHKNITSSKISDTLQSLFSNCVQVAASAYAGNYKDKWLPQWGDDSDSIWSGLTEVQLEHDERTLSSYGQYQEKLNDLRQRYKLNQDGFANKVDALVITHYAGKKGLISSAIGRLKKLAKSNQFTDKSLKEFLKCINGITSNDIREVGHETLRKVIMQKYARILCLSDNQIIIYPGKPDDSFNSLFQKDQIGCSSVSDAQLSAGDDPLFKTILSLRQGPRKIRASIVDLADKPVEALNLIVCLSVCTGLSGSAGSIKGIEEPERACLEASVNSISDRKPAVARFLVADFLQRWDWYLWVANAALPLPAKSNAPKILSDEELVQQLNQLNRMPSTGSTFVPVEIAKILANLFANYAEKAGEDYLAKYQGIWQPRLGQARGGVHSKDYKAKSDIIRWSDFVAEYKAVPLISEKVKGGNLYDSKLEMLRDMYKKDEPFKNAINNVVDDYYKKKADQINAAIDRLKKLADRHFSYQPLAKNFLKKMGTLNRWQIDQIACAGILEYFFEEYALMCCFSYSGIKMLYPASPPELMKPYFKKWGIEWYKLRYREDKPDRPASIKSDHVSTGSDDDMSDCSSRSRTSSDSGRSLSDSDAFSGSDASPEAKERPPAVATSKSTFFFDIPLSGSALQGNRPEPVSPTSAGSSSTKSNPESASSASGEPFLTKSSSAAVSSSSSPPPKRHASRARFSSRTRLSMWRPKAQPESVHAISPDDARAQMQLQECMLNYQAALLLAQSKLLRKLMNAGVAMTPAQLSAACSTAAEGVLSNKLDDNAFLKKFRL